MLQSWNSDYQSWDSNSKEETFLIRKNEKTNSDIKIKIQEIDAPNIKQGDFNHESSQQRIYYDNNKTVTESCEYDEIPNNEFDSDGTLLLTRAAGTEIIVTPISRGNSVTDLQETETEPEIMDFNLLCPDMDGGN